MEEACTIEVGQCSFMNEGLILFDGDCKLHCHAIWACTVISHLNNVQPLYKYVCMYHFVYMGVLVVDVPDRPFPPSPPILPQFVTADSSVPSTPTNPSTSSSGWRFLLAEKHYGREEMLALMPDQPTRPPMNSELESILLDEAITPLALLPLTEDEQVRTYFTAPHDDSGVW